MTLGGSPTASGGTGRLTIVWSAVPPDPTLSCTDCENPSVTPDVTTTYTVTVSDRNGCEVAAEVTVTVDVPALPPPVGNTVTVTREADDLLLQWDEAGGSTVDYRVRRSIDPDFPTPGDDLGTGPADTPFRLVDEMFAVGSPRYYRVAGINCAGDEGPLE